MPKFLLAVSYTSEGIKGVRKDKASGRKAAASHAAESVGGRLEALYYCLGQDDAIAIVDVPDTAAAAALALAVSGSGLAHARTTALLTIEEADKALSASVSYRAPGH